MKTYWIRYIYIFAVGVNSHMIEIYNTYSEEQGLEELVDTIEHTRATEVLKEAKKYITSTEQLALIKHFLKYKSDGISAPDGKYYSY